MLTCVSSTKKTMVNADYQSLLTIYIYITPKKGTDLQVKKNLKTAYIQSLIKAIRVIQLDSPHLLFPRL